MRADSPSRPFFRRGPVSSTTKRGTAMRSGLTHLPGFLEMLAAERGAAANTLEAYRRDLEDFIGFVMGQERTIAEVGAADINAYLKAAGEVGLAATSRARRLSAIRQFFKFLAAEGYVEGDP